MMESKTFIFIGRSGCGKGTQVDLLESYLHKKDPKHGTLVASSGEKFRVLAKQDSYAGQLTKEMLDHGRLMPMAMAIWAWTDTILHGLKKDEYIIFDGAPRKELEVDIMESALINFYKRPKPVVIVLNVSESWAITRLKERGRDDDQREEDILNRQKFFETDVAPTIERFRQHGKFDVFDIDGEQSIEDVHKEIVEKVGLKH